MKVISLILAIFGTAALFAPRPTQYRIKGQPDYPIDDVTVAELALQKPGLGINIHQRQKPATGAGGTRLRMPLPPWPTPTPRK